MIVRWSAWLRRVRRWFSRSEWAVRWLKLPRAEGAGAEPGLLLIQIDGLSQAQFQRALAAGRMPHLRRLLEREGYRQYTFYSGLPASTPAVQGELFYGQRVAVPAFSFWDSQAQRTARMFDQAAAQRVENELAQSGEPLLAGGSAYCDIYSGGAEEAHFCASTIGLSNLLQQARAWKLMTVLLWNGWSLARIITLAILELLLAIVDFFRGVIRGSELWPELKFIPSRVVVSIVLRELAVIGAGMDVTRGLPIVHLNLLGYDEQAHRRGPSSAFAHWALKGIDHAVRRLWIEARRSQRRDYDVWIYSDHGQEATVPYRRITGHSVGEMVAKILEASSAEEALPETGRGTQSGRAGWMSQARGTRWLGRPSGPNSHSVDEIRVTAMGPLGHVYLPEELLQGGTKQKELLARKLVRDGKIPLVLLADGPNSAIGVNERGTFRLPEQASEVLGADHPFLYDVSRDLVELCHHRHAGDLIISGWSPDKPPVSFPVESGAHAGPGFEETHAFALIPADVPVRQSGGQYVRPADLRDAALEHLGRRPPRPAVPIPVPSAVPSVSAEPALPLPRRLRVVTYNVHACIGMDGRLSTSRIARVIRQCHADVVALQELDVRRPRTGHLDQAHEIARLLEMDFHFHPAWQVEEEGYGNAVLSRLPLRLVRRGGLPQAREKARSEPRGALWVELDVGGRHLHVVNTHLGLGRRERFRQVSSLMGSQWLSHPQCRPPLILCGDFNANPWSQAYRNVSRYLFDVQRQLNGHRPRATWLSGRPLHRIDHVFVSQGIRVCRVVVPRTQLAQVASDHLPLVVELEIID